MNLIEVSLLVVVAIVGVIVIPLALGMFIGRAIHEMAGEEEGPIFEAEDLASLAEFSNYSRQAHADDDMRRRQLKNLAGLIVVKH